MILLQSTAQLVLIAALAFEPGALGAHAVAQDAPPVRTIDQTPPERVDTQEGQLDPARRSPVIQPASGENDSPGTDRAKEPAYRMPLLREGSFLTEARGRLYHDDGVGFWIFEAEPDRLPTTAGFRVPLRFIMLPSTKLQQMQRTIESGDVDIIFELTGRIFVYDNHNYVLPIDAAIAEQRPSEPEAPLPPAGEDDLTPEELIARIREEVPIARSLAPLTEGEAGDDASLPMAEGGLIVMRRGRLARNARGGWEFIFTADADGRADPPMTVLPCLLLERMQRDAMQPGTRDTLHISGQVYTYRGRNFVLPTLYQVLRHTPNLQR